MSDIDREAGEGAPPAGVAGATPSVLTVAEDTDSGPPGSAHIDTSIATGAVVPSAVEDGSSVAGYSMQSGSSSPSSEQLEIPNAVIPDEPSIPSADPAPGEQEPSAAGGSPMEVVQDKKSESEADNPASSGACRQLRREGRAALPETTD